MADGYTPQYNYDDRLLTTRDRARAALQDVGDEQNDDGETLWEFSDGTIEAMLASYPYREAVAQLASQLATRYAKMPDEYDEDGGLKVTYKGLVKRFEALADEMRGTVEVVQAPTPTYAAVAVLPAGQAAADGLRFGSCAGPVDTWGSGRGRFRRL